MSRRQGERGKEKETRIKIFKLLCTSPDAVPQQQILDHLEIKGSSPGNQLRKLAEDNIVVNIAPKTEKQRPGKANIWKLSSDAESILRCMFESFDSDPKQLLEVFNTPSVQDQIARFVKKINDDLAQCWPIAYEDDDPYEDVYFRLEAALNEGMMVSPTFLRAKVSGDFPPEYDIIQFFLNKEAHGQYFRTEIRNPHPVFGYLSFIMLDLAKYPDQMDRLLVDVNRDLITGFMSMVFPNINSPIQTFISPNVKGEVYAQ